MTTIPAASANTGAVPGTGSALAKLGTDTTTFLKLLTTQMQNQDPLKPMDTSEYTQQLVQFSQVEQSIQQSQSLKDILAKLSATDLSSAATMIGKIASFDSSIGGLGATGDVGWQVAPDRTPRTMTATVSDVEGTPIATRAIDPASRSFTWDGTDDHGVRAPAGTYTLAITANDAAGASIPVSVAAQGVVDEIVVEHGQLSVLANGQRYNSNSLLRIGSHRA